MAVNIPDKLTDARVWLFALGYAIETPGYLDPVSTADALLDSFRARFPDPISEWKRKVTP